MPKSFVRTSGGNRLVKNGGTVTVPDPADLPLPGTFADWSVSNANADPSNDGLIDGKLTVSIGTMPANVATVEYRIGASAWSTAVVVSGQFSIVGLINGVSASVQLRGRNATGTGVASAAKAAVPYVKGGGHDRADDSFLIGKTVQSLTANFGGVGDNATDNRTAILNALAWLKGGNDRALYIPTGTFVCNGELNSYTSLSAARSGSVIYGDGPTKSIIKHTQDAGGTTANGTGTRLILQSLSAPIVRDFAIIAPNTTARAGGAQAAHGYGLNFTNCSDGLIHNVWVLGVAAGHMMFTGGAGPCVRMLVQHSKVGSGGYHAGADGFHFTGAGSADNIAEYSIADGCGDDGFASIGYQSNTSTGHIFRYNISKNGTGGACFSFEGASNAQCYGNVGQNSTGPGVRIASKGGSIKSGAVNGVTVTGNVFSNVNQGSVPDAGAVSMTASYSTIQNVTISGNTITSPGDGKGVYTNSTAGTNADSGTAMTIQATITGNIMTGITSAYTVDTEATLTGTSNTVNGVGSNP